MKHSNGVPRIAAVIATLLISIIGAQGQVLAEEKAWTLQERTLPAPGVVADLNVHERFSHGEYLKTIDSPESEQVFAELGAFLLKYLKGQPEGVIE